MSRLLVAGAVLSQPVLSDHADTAGGTVAAGLGRVFQGPEGLPERQTTGLGVLESYPSSGLALRRA